MIRQAVELIFGYRMELLKNERIRLFPQLGVTDTTQFLTFILHPHPVMTANGAGPVGDQKMTLEMELENGVGGKGQSWREMVQKCTNEWLQPQQQSAPGFMAQVTLWQLGRPLS